jgi:Rieske Fe-S protein
VYAFRLSCPHKNTALRWKEANQRFECPKHKSKYGPDGAFISGRATRSMDRLGIKVKNAQVIVALSEVYLQDKDPRGWAAAMVRV